MSRLAGMIRLTGLKAASRSQHDSRMAAIEEVRRLKRIVAIGVYVAIFGFEPIYLFVLHQKPVDVLINLVIGLMIATTAIQGAFGQVYKLRKRSSYPGVVVVEVGAAKTLSEAAGVALELTKYLFGASAGWLGLLTDNDELRVSATHGMTMEQVQAYLRHDKAKVVQAIRRQDTVQLPWGEGDRTLVLIPIVAWQRSLGVVGLVCDRPSRDARDRELLLDVGLAIGLSLESLRQKEDLQDTLSLLTATLDSTADGILVVDRAGKIVTMNHQFGEMWRIPDDVLDSKDDNRAISYVLDQLVDPAEFLRKITELYSQPLAESSDVLQFHDGRVFERYSQPQRVEGEIVGRVWCFRDVTERKQSEETIRHLAYHDALTDLPNRSLFTDRLTVALAQSRRSGQRVAVMFLDIDRFKLVNDTLGHVAGDELLKAIGAELGALIREGDTVARVGGDEFTLLFTGLDENADVPELAERILDTVRQPRTLGGNQASVSTSLGIAVFPADGRDVETLLRNADTAMYRAKQQGRDNFQEYTPAMSAEILNRVLLESDLRRALKNDEFVVHFQPQVDRETWRITGAEALIRWQHPKRGLVYPADFVSAAEDTGLIVPIGEWVLREACSANKRWQDAGLPPLTVTVNLSARQFQQSNLVGMIEKALADNDLDPQYLELEITEGTTIQDPDYAARVIQQIRSMGVRISIDDFGTGYSSLGYLKRFKIDRLKIDRSFVRDIETDPNDAAIATAVIVMAHSLGLRVVAEGVETEEQLAFLLENGCDEFQGYLVGRPAPEEELAALLARMGDHQMWLASLAHPGRLLPDAS